MYSAIVLPLALLIDRLAGDPDSRFHPVALLGRLISWWGKPEIWPMRARKFIGAMMWLLTVFIFAVPFFLVSIVLPWYIYLICAPFLLKICFAWRALEEHTCRVVSAARYDLELARSQVGRMVSRDSGSLTKEQVLSAGYESMSENLVDSIISPLFFFGLAGLTGAAVYRAANTMDAMLGYKDERIDLGWWSARMDDIFNYIPARITGLLLLLYFSCIGQFQPAYTALKLDGKKRPGFNGGIPMAIMAGGTGVRFDKPGVYTIGPGIRSLEEGGPDILKAVRVITLAFSALLIGTLLLLQILLNI